MFNELTKWCHREAIICGQEQRYQVEVSPFFQVQEQLSHLPSFESQYAEKHSPARNHQHHRAGRTPLIVPGPTLKRVKSQPVYQIQANQVNSKENSHCPSPLNYPKRPAASIHHSQKRPPIRILYDNQENTTQSQSYCSTSKVNINSSPYEHRPPYSPLNRQGRSPGDVGDCSLGDERSGVVPLEEFNRMVNINLNLIKLIEENYRPMKASVGQMEKEHQQRQKLIEALQMKVRRMKGEMIGDC